MGANTHTRPYENYYAQVMRIAYPEMDMGRELLRLNLGMYAVLELQDTQITTAGCGFAGHARMGFALA